MMSGLFQGLEIGNRALMAHQMVLQTIGHNIANVNTPGYSRQRVRILAANPEISVHGPIGAGVSADNVRHVRDLFLGKQYRETQKSLGKWSYKGKTLNQIESMLNELQDNSLSAMLNEFWNAWSSLSTNSDATAARTNVLAAAKQVINSLKQLTSDLRLQREAVDRDMTSMTSEVNRITRELARLNHRISYTELDGSRANDLRDRRDHLIDDLSNMIDVNVTEKENGANIVAMGAMILVDGSSSIDVGHKTVRAGGVVSHQLVWKGTEVRLKNINGQMAGLVEVRDEVIPRYQEQLNKLTKTLVEQVNSLHMAGYGLDGSTGVAFFDPNYTDAATIRLNPEIQQDISRIAASQSPDGDNLTALALSDLRNSLVLADNTMTINDFYNNLVGGLGIEAREAGSCTNNYELLAHKIDNQRQSVQGVSLDEEMTNLIKSQHAYDAAARVITVMDLALETVISKMGMTAR
jgi:flagellar hook-associated protein 1 FlgK